MQYSKILYGTAAALFGTLVWEHIARKNNSDFKPSIAMDYVYKNSKAGFTKLGKGLATLSSFYTYLDLREVGQTVSDLAEPTLKTIVSPYYMVKGYATKVNVYDHPYLVMAGSLTLLLLSYYLYRRYDPQLGKSFSSLVKKMYNRN